MSKQISHQVMEFNGSLKVNAYDLPTPKDEQILVKVKYCGVCHSDLHIYEGYFSLGDGQKMDLSKSSKLPLTPGHEISGIVEQIGSKVTNVKVGDRVALYPVLGCGKCSKCASGQENICPFQKFFGASMNGGFSSHVVCAAKQAVPINFDDVFAAVSCCSGITTYSSIKKLGNVSKKDRILFVGAGGLGLMALQIFRALHPDHPGPVVADIDPVKLEAALKNGASEAINLKTDSKFLHVTSEGSWIGRGFDGIIDFVGSGTTTSQVVPLLNKGGVLVLVGLFGGSSKLAATLLPLKGCSILGNYLGTLAEFKELMELLHRGAIQPPPIQLRPFSDAQQALLDLRDGKVTGRTVLKIDQHSSL